MTLLVMGVMIGGWVDPVVMFMLGTVAALVINYPDVAEQRARIDAHAKAALLMASILLAAGAFTGIMTGTGMPKAMAAVAVAHVPAGAEQQVPVALGLLGTPLSVLFDPDSFYFGVLPLVAEVSKSLGGQPIQVAQGALLGMHTVGFPHQPADPGDLPRGRPERHRARRAPALRLPLPPGGLRGDDGGGGRHGGDPAVRTVRIGAGAGYSGDRTEPALELAERGALDYLVFECLAERTIALAQ